ncbi:hypothetical protein [Sorangium sp. So ce124]|uniref:hypothetical protein n=1 Tax=Sorangium sp. So ce124 TaxID=3133280 RepID=UPI003F603733
MLKIRDEQRRALAEAQEARFVEALGAHLREHHPDAVGGVPAPVMRRRIERGVARARSHGLTWESSIATFVALMFKIAPNFDEYPPIRAVLAARGRPPDERVGQLFERIRGEDWQRAMRRYDARAWGLDEGGGGSA